MAAKQVQTVLGPVDPDELGLTLCHEHLSMQTDQIYYRPPPPHLAHMADLPINPDTYQLITQNPMYHRSTLILNDEEAQSAITEDLKLFKANGGGTIVDQGSLGLGRKDQFLKQVAMETGVKVVAGAGFYLFKAQPDWSQNYSVEKMAEFIREQLSTPLDDEKGIRCGLIGEVACGWPIHDFEKRSIEASAVVQSETGCPVLVHPPHTKEGLLEVVRIYEEAGGRADKLTMAHLDWPIKHSETLAFASESPHVYLELDSFGSQQDVEGYPSFPTDLQRIQLVKDLVQEGFGHRIVVGHDLWGKIKLAKYGGHGYSHMIHSVIEVMKQQGLGLDVIQKMTVDNPKNWLAF